MDREKDIDLERMEQEDIDNIEEILAEEPQDFIDSIIEFANEKPKKAALIVGVLITMFGVGAVATFPTPKPLKVMEWSVDDAKIEEMKQTLIDGVTIEELYDGRTVYSWSWGMYDGNAYLKVESEDGVDVYDTTDGELDDSYGLDEMKRNFIGQVGTYYSEDAVMTVNIDEQYNVDIAIEMKDEMEVEDVAQEIVEDMAVETVEEEVEVIVEDITVETAEEIVEDMTVETAEEAVEETAEDMTVETAEEVEEIVEDTTEEDTEEDTEQPVILSAEIVAETMIEVVLSTGDVVRLTWADKNVFEANPTEEFSEEALELMPEICDELTETEYYLSAEELEIFANGYEVEVLINFVSQVQFNLYLDGEMVIFEGRAHKVQEGNDFAIYQEEDYTIYFSEYSDTRMLITAYNPEFEMVMQIIMEVEKDDFYPADPEDE